MTYIKIRGARAHNLKNIDVDIPINQITCIKGPSGSGKSSLAFHTLYNESKRRYLNSMPGSFKFFANRPLQADVDEINPVLPAFALAQSNPIMSSRTCAMDVVGLLEKLQKVFYFLGQPYCPHHNRPYQYLMPSAQIGWAIDKWKIRENDIVHLFIQKDDYQKIYGPNTFSSRFFDCHENKINTFQKNGSLYEMLRFKYGKINLLNKKSEEFSRLKEGQEITLFSERHKRPVAIKYSKSKLCPECCNISPKKSIEHYSPYNALGACQSCSGHGGILIYDEEKIFPNLNLSFSENAAPIFNYKRLSIFKKSFIKEIESNGYSDKTLFKKFNKQMWNAIRHGGDHFLGLDGVFQYLAKKSYKKDVRILLRGLQREERCLLCGGTRISEYARGTKISCKKNTISFEEILYCSLEGLVIKLTDILDSYLSQNDKNSHNIFLLKSTISLLRVACRIGLGSTPLLKNAKNLTPGEYQRLLMVKYLSYEGSGSLFIFDEPSLGLSQKEQKKLFYEMTKLRDQGNTILLVEHASIFYQLSDEIIEMGQGSGLDGGKIIYQGPAYCQSYSPNLEQEFSFIKRKPTSWIIIRDIKCENYHKSEIKVPIDCLTQVKGDSSSGKVQIMVRAFPDIVKGHIENIYRRSMAYSYQLLSIQGDLQDVFLINSNFGKVTRRSTVGSFLGLSQEVRKYYSCLSISKLLDLRPGHFSVNSTLGRCPICEGKGFKVVEMVYLDDIQITCENCWGKGLNPEYASLSDGHLTAHEAFSLPMREIIGHLDLTPKYYRIWQYVQLLNLDYLSLSRELNSLSGGERQRINLLAYLTKNIKNSLLVFENISFGLSERELAKLVVLLRQICDRSNSIVVVDNHDFFTRASDFTIDFD